MSFLVRKENLAFSWGILWKEDLFITLLPFTDVLSFSTLWVGMFSATLTFGNMLVCQVVESIHLSYGWIQKQTFDLAAMTLLKQDLRMMILQKLCIMMAACSLALCTLRAKWTHGTTSYQRCLSSARTLDLNWCNDEEYGSLDFFFSYLLFFLHQCLLIRRHPSLGFPWQQSQRVLPRYHNVTPGAQPITRF